jgi:Tol biopolymer transport system component
MIPALTMPLTPGMRLGSYDIVAPIGAGGMGEVYRARDTKLNRDVALKILPDTVAADPDRLARFRREAQVLASLNHPNIGQIYGFEDGTSPFALVLELIEGPTLADRIADGPIPVSEALPIARQIAEALEAAHEHGIIHRDLKPANVKVKDDGVVKVLDFGLAKALDPTAASSAEALNSPTLTMRATQMGLIIGTAAYMSPEQAKAKAVDRRADIWAFGAVLYEMLSGNRAFAGDDISDTLAAVLRQDVDWNTLPTDTPAAVRRLIARCLDRDVKRRLRDIGEARVVLENPASGETTAPTAVTPAAQATLAPPRSMWRRVAPAAFAAIITATLGAVAAWYFKPALPASVTRFAITLPEGQGFSGVSRHFLALSPDGAHMVYVGTPTRLYLRSMSEVDIKPIQGTEGHSIVSEPVFSPDGRSVAFYADADRTLKRVALAGGAAVTICQADDPIGMTWGPDGIVFGQLKGILRVSANGGTPEVLAVSSGDEMLHGPEILPGGQHLLFSVSSKTDLDRWDKAHIVVQSLKTGERTTIIEGGSDARYLPSGHLIYAVSGTLFVVDFDLDTLQVTGGPVPVLEGVRRATPPATGAAQFSVSRTGSLVYVPGPASLTGAQRDIVIADRNGDMTPLKLPPGPYAAPRASPDGKRVAFEMIDGKEAVIATYDLRGGTSIQRITYGGNNRFPVWSSDGKRLTFQSDREGDLAIFSQPADSAGRAERLTKPAQGESHIPESWSPTGDALLFSVIRGTTATATPGRGEASLWTYSTADRKTRPFGDVRASYPTNAVFSPDGHWVAYVSNERSRTTVYVQPFPSAGAKYQLFAKDGDSPHEVVWSPDGKELIYNPRPGGFEAVSVRTTPTFAFGNPVVVPRQFQVGGPPANRRGYDITRDGKFVATIVHGYQMEGGPAGTMRHVQVVVNWFEELKQRTRN